MMKEDKTNKILMERTKKQLQKRPEIFVSFSIL